MKKLKPLPVVLRLCHVLAVIALRVTAQTASVNTVEDLSLEVVPCAPGYYCATDGSIMEPCPEGSQHVLFSETDLTEFAVCSSSSSSASQTRALDEELISIDVGFAIDAPALDEQATHGFWTALQTQVVDASPNILDLSYQEYLALDVSLCAQGHYCAPVYTATAAAAAAMPCPQGTYGAHEGQSECTLCPAHLSTLSEGSIDFRNRTIDIVGQRRIGAWIPLIAAHQQERQLDDALDLEPQLAALYGVPLEAMVVRLP